MTKIIKVDKVNCDSFVSKRRAAQAGTKAPEPIPWVVVCFYVGQEEDPSSMLYWAGMHWDHDATLAVKHVSSKAARLSIKDIPLQPKGYSSPIERKL